MDKFRRNRFSCGSFFVDSCNCERVPRPVGLSNAELKPISLSLHPINKIAKVNTFLKDSDENLMKPQQNVATTKRHLRSFSHPAINFIFTCENRDLCGSTNKSENCKSNCESGEPSLQLIESSKSIEKAQQYFAESGILGPSNLSSSRDYIRKTSRIHLDQSLKIKIRKSSLCLLSRSFGDKYGSIAPACTPVPQPKPPEKTNDELIVENLQKQVYSLKDIIETGETKIIMLRVEVNKIKRVLQELMYANSQNQSKFTLDNPVCVFCQQEPGFSQVLLEPCKQLI